MKLNFKTYLFFYLLTHLTTVSEGQTTKHTTYTNLVWVNDYLKIKLNDKWSFYFDASYRTKDWLNHWSQVKLNPGLTYKVNPKISATAGLAYFTGYDPHYLSREYRPWEQIQYSHQLSPAIVVSHRVRAEQRWNQKVVNDKLINDFNYSNRYRYQVALKYYFTKDTIQNAQGTVKTPRTNKNALYLILSDEIMMNSGKEIIYNTFDQNRITGGIGYKLNEHFEFSVTYMNAYIMRNSKNKFDNNNIIVLNLYQNF